MQKNNANKPIDGLIRFLSFPDEKGNADLIRNYFRSRYPEFKCETQANNADGYVPGHFILELKSKQKDWYKGLIQGLAYKRTLDVTIIVVATNHFLGVWDVKDLPNQLLEDIYQSDSSASTLGIQLAKKYRFLEKSILKKAIWKGEELTGILAIDKTSVIRDIHIFEKTLLHAKKTRFRITTSNFTNILKEMAEYFVTPIKAVSAFYSMIFGWNEESIIQFSKKLPDTASINGEPISHLNPNKKAKFKEFVEKYYIYLESNENVDDFFAKYDRALDTVDRDFRIKNGIFFTDLSLSKFVLWYIKQFISNLGEDYIVIDPACGSGNLVTNWRAPLQLRHKIVSEIEPELLFTVENRMKGDAWHFGKYTVVPRVDEGKGLNFLTYSATEYLNILKSYLVGQDVNKPIAFLCNPPYRGDDDQSASKIDYQIHPDILEIIGKEASSERYNCFLAQMKLICDKAPDSGIPEESLLLVFTKSSWLTNRPSFEKIKRSISDAFEFQGGLLFNSKEFFQLKAKFPIAFTIWKYKNCKSNKKIQDKPILLQDLTWVDNKLLKNLPWPNSYKNNNLELDNLCNEIINDKRSIYVSLNSSHQLSIRAWIEQKMYDFKRDRRKSEIGKENVGGLPRNDHRMKNKKAYGEPSGLFIGFMDNLTPCRIKKSKTNVPWFRLDSAFMDCRKIRCVSGPTPVKSYCAFDFDSAKKTFFWFAIGRTISQTGFPMWVDAIELWAPVITEKNESLLKKYIFSIGLADNECVETFFPFNNPIEGAPLIHVNNPMAPNNPDSFWSTTIVPSLKQESNTAPDLLIQSVYKLYKEWSNRFRFKPEVYLTIDKPYFIDGGTLKKTAGLIQIKDFAESENDIELLSLIQNIKDNLKIVKNEFYKFLLATDGLNYFIGQQNQLIKDSSSLIPLYNDNQFKPESEFEKTIEKRLSLMAIILDTLKNDKNLGRTKLAKILYIT